jgi:hypothetical protein
MPNQWGWITFNISYQGVCLVLVGCALILVGFVIDCLWFLSYKLVKPLSVACVCESLHAVILSNFCVKYSGVVCWFGMACLFYFWVDSFECRRKRRRRWLRGIWRGRPGTLCCPRQASSWCISGPNYLSVALLHVYKVHVFHLLYGWLVPPEVLLIHP